MSHPSARLPPGNPEHSILSMSSNLHPDTSNRGTSVKDVDPRVLRRILFEVKRNNDEAALALPYEKTPMTEPASNSLQGYTSYIGRVCRTWHTTMQDDPSFWVVIIAFIDRNYTPDSLINSPIRTYIRLSRSLPLSVYLIRRLSAPLFVDVDEYAAVKALMELIWWDMDRVETLAVHTNHSSSLPDVCKILYDIKPSQLYALILKSNSDDSVLCRQTTALGVPALTNHSAPYPIRLTDFRIDGRSLLVLLEQDRFIHLYSVLSNLKFLCITNLTHRVDRFTEGKVGLLFSIITTLSHLSTVIFDTFELPSPTPAPPYLQISAPAEVKFLKVRRSGGDSLRYILECVSPEELCLGTCHFTVPTAIPARSRVLSLVKIGAIEGLAETLVRWNGLVLEIVDCPILTDTFLRRMQHHAATRHRPLFAKLNHLRIIDCPNFTPLGLLDFLKERAFALISAPFPLPVGGNQVAPTLGHVVLESLEVLGRSPKLEHGDLVLGSQTRNVAHSLEWPTKDTLGEDERSRSCPSPASLLQTRGLEGLECRCLPCSLANACLETGLISSSL